MSGHLDKWIEVFESDDQTLEEYFRSLHDPFLETGVWELNGDYEYTIQTQVEAAKHDITAPEISEPEIEQRAKEINEKLQDSRFTPYDFSYKEGNTRFSLQKTDDGILNGKLQTSPESLNTEEAMESGTLLYELRQAYKRIAEPNETEYLETCVEENNDSDPSPHSDSIYQIKIPADYDPEILQKTAESITNTATDIENLHQSLNALAKGYKREE